MDILEEGIIKTRKDHKCWGCREVIPKGREVQHCKGVDCGKHWTTYWCHPCDSVWKEVHGEYDPDFGLDYGFIADHHAGLLSVARSAKAISTAEGVDTKEGESGT